MFIYFQSWGALLLLC